MSRDTSQEAVVRWVCDWMMMVQNLYFHSSPVYIVKRLNEVNVFDKISLFVNITYDETWVVGALSKILAEFEFQGHRPHFWESPSLNMANRSFCKKILGIFLSPSK